MSSDPSVEMSFTDCEWRTLEFDKTPLIHFVPTEPIAHEHVSKSIYNSLGQKNSTFNAQLFDGMGETEDLIRWWTCAEKFFSLVKVTNANKRFELVPTFLAEDRILKNLCTEAHKAVALVKINQSTRQWTPLAPHPTLPSVRQHSTSFVTS